MVAHRYGRLVPIETIVLIVISVVLTPGIALGIVALLVNVADRAQFGPSSGRAEVDEDEVDHRFY